MRGRVIASVLVCGLVGGGAVTRGWTAAKPAPSALPAGEAVDPVGSLPAPYRDGLRELLDVGVEETGIAGGALLRSRLLDARRAGVGTGPLAAAPLERSRGATDWGEVYQRAAPGVVFLALEGGFGSGFLVEDGRWLVTNHHVASGGELDAQRRWWVNAYLGSLDERGVMVPGSEPVPAVVYDWDVARDLALLRLEPASPADVGPERALSLRPSAAPGPRAGEEVAIIGNAALGLLWSLKAGHVAAIGTVSTSMPELLSQVDARLRRTSVGLADPLTGEVGAAVAEQYRDWIGADTLLIQATAPSSRGDSGGPLLDSEGRVVGITMGSLSDTETSDSTHFYVHVEELEELLRDRPERPLLELATSPWDSRAVAYRLHDLTGSGRPDALVGVDERGQAALYALDLTGSWDGAPFRAVLPLTAPILATHGAPTPPHFLTVYRDGTVIAADDGTEVRWRLSLSAQPTASAMDPTGRLAAVGLVDGSVAWIDRLEGSVVARVRVHEAAVLDLAFCPRTGGALWVAVADGTLRRVHPRGKGDRMLRAERPVVAVEVVDLGGEGLLVAEREGPVRLLDAEGGRVAWSQPAVSAYALRIDRERGLVAVSPQSDAPLLTWLDLGSGRVVEESRLPASPWSFELSPDGRSVLLAFLGRGTYGIWSRDRREMLGEWPVSAAGLRESPPREFGWVGERVLVSGSGGSLALLDPETGPRGSWWHYSVERLDFDAVVERRAFDAEFAMVSDPDLATLYALYDRDDDGRMDVVRLDVDGDGRADQQYTRDPADPREWRRGTVGTAPLFLPAEELPDGWRPGYRRFLGALQAGAKQRRGE